MPGDRPDRVGTHERPEHLPERAVLRGGVRHLPRTFYFDTDRVVIAAADTFKYGNPCVPGPFVRTDILPEFAAAADEKM